MTTNVLIVAAHPDDEVLGCGGTISRLVKENQNVFIAILGEGITSRYQNRQDAEEADIELLHSNCRKVMELLGAEDLFTYSLPDNRFDSMPILDIIKIIENLVKSIHPEIIYTHAGGDLNIDHFITHRSVITAVRPLVDCPVKDIYSFETPSSTEWAFQQFQPNFLPNVFVDVSQTIENKIDAMAVYESELRSFPHPRSSEALRIAARRWGSVVGVEFAEAFQLIRSIR